MCINNLNDGEKDLIETVIPFISNFQGLRITSAEKDVIKEILQNDNYVSLFKSNDPTFIIIKFLQKCKSEKIEISDENFNILFNNKNYKNDDTTNNNNRSEINNDNFLDIIKNATYGLFSKEFLDYIEKKPELLIEILEKRGLDFSTKIQKSEIQHELIKLENDISILNTAINKTNTRIEKKAYLNTFFITSSIWLLSYLNNNINNYATLIIDSFIIYKIGETIYKSARYASPDIKDVDDFETYLSYVKNTIKFGEIKGLTYETIETIKKVLNPIKV